MEAQGQFRALLQRVGEGSQEAAEELCRLYGGHILAVVRRRMHKQLRSRFDSHDFTQAVWASFFALKGSQQRFTGPDALIAYLAQVAHNKVVSEMRGHVVSQKRAAFREQSFNDSTQSGAPEPQGREPTPSQLAMAEEKWAQLLEQVPPHRRHILHLLRAGNTPGETADSLGVDRSTISRFVKRLEKAQEDHAISSPPNRDTSWEDHAGG